MSKTNNTTAMQVTIYWDRQDPSNAGWAYAVRYDEGHGWESDCSEGLDDGIGEDDLDGARADACRELSLDVNSVHWTRLTDGGWRGAWTK